MRRTAPKSPTDQPIGKTVGHRKERPTSLEDADRLMHTAWALRGTDKLVPRGLYRFKTFEEADRWMTEMVARTHARELSKKMSHASSTPSTKREPTTE